MNGLEEQIQLLKYNKQQKNNYLIYVYLKPSGLANTSMVL